MSKEMWIIALGFAVVVVPFLGIPGAWRTGLLVLSGLGLVVLGFYLRGESILRGSARTDRHTFVDNAHPRHTEEAAPVHTAHDEGITPLD